jgi:hypothetical protein
MIVVESLEVRMPRSQAIQAQPEWSLAGILIFLFETCHGFDRLFLDDPAGMQA